MNSLMNFSRRCLCYYKHNIIFYLNLILTGRISLDKQLSEKSCGSLSTPSDYLETMCKGPNLRKPVPQDTASKVLPDPITEVLTAAIEKQMIVIL